MLYKVLKFPVFTKHHLLGYLITFTCLLFKETFNCDSQTVRLFYVLDYEIARLAFDDGGATYYQATSALLWCRPGEVVGRFYNVNVYNMYILLEGFNEDRMLE